MKGIIVEKKNGYAILLTKEGQFEKVKDKAEYSIGSEYDIRNNYFINKKFASMAASIALILGMSTAAYGYVTPSEYVTIDINPSVEIVVNMFNKVIKVKPLNDDGTKVVENLNLNNKNLQEAVNLVVKSAKDEGYLAQELNNEILVTVCAKNDDKSKVTETKLAEEVKKELEVEKVEYTPINTQSVTVKRQEEAEKLGISSGKMNLIEKIEKVQPGIDYKEYSEKSVKELMKEIKEVKKEEKTIDKENKDKNKSEQNNEVDKPKQENVQPEKKQEKDTQKEDNQKERNQKVKSFVPEEKVKNNSKSYEELKKQKELRNKLEDRWKNRYNIYKIN